MTQKNFKAAKATLSAFTLALLYGQAASGQTTTSPFSSPTNWPHKLIQKWKIPHGEAGGSPIFVGDRVYLFVREPGMVDGSYCLNAEDGAEIWFEKYHSGGGVENPPPAGRPLSVATPVLAGDRLVTMGPAGALSCLIAETGKLAWRLGEREQFSKYFTTRSPIVVGDVVIAHPPADDFGTVSCFEIATGKKKWDWTCDSPSYATPTATTVGGTDVVIVQTDESICALKASDGMLVWKSPCELSGADYNAVKPLVIGDMVIYAGHSRGATAVKLGKEGEAFTAKELWNNADLCPQFSSLLLKDGLLYCLNRRGNFVCVNARTGKTAWVEPLGGHGAYGSIVDGGSVLFAMTPQSKLIVIKPGEKAFEELTSIKVSDKPVFGTPSVLGAGVCIQDQDSIALWVIQ